jgi:hypothetical protein
MNLRTTFNIEAPPFRIGYDDSVMLIGSCFASSIGEQLARGRMSVMVNPAGNVYNPVSVCNTLNNILDGKEFGTDDLHFHDGMWHSFYHYTDFSSEDPIKTLDRINRKLAEASLFLKKASYLIITFGTARIFRLKKTGIVVSNCHKIPSGQFVSELLTVSEIVTLMNQELDRLSDLFPGLKVIFTISPVRHLKDGAHGNQVSKSVLFLAVEELLGHSSIPQYFPAYELLMDDLRDYRFYDNDMTHPSESAINYIWEAFSGCYFEDATLKLWNEAVKITKARSHRFLSDSNTKKRDFALKMLSLISEFEKKTPSINFSDEKSYFLDLLKPRKLDD